MNFLKEQTFFGAKIHKGLCMKSKRGIIISLIQNIELEHIYRFDLLLN